MNKKLAIWGWWQGGNLGDNWIKKVLCKIFPDACFIDTKVKDFSEYGFVICGGGGLFIYDTISPWTDYSQNIPFGMLGLGAEFPHKTENALKLKEKSSFFYLRDQYSLDCMKITNLPRSYDLTFYDPLPKINFGEADMNKLLFIWRDGHELLSNPQFNEYIKFEDNYTRAIEIIEKKFKETDLNDFQTRDNNIETITEDVGFVISGRFHGIVAAIQRHIPCIAIDICPKIRILMHDCGLDKYCIKISEIDKLESLIDSAKEEYREIYEKQDEYTKRAQIALLKDVENAKNIIFKTLNRKKVIHYGSYWMKDNDVVKTMCDDLNIAADVTEIDLKVYSKNPDGRIKAKIKTPNGLLCILDHSKILEDIDLYHPDIIIFNSGGLVPEDELFAYMRNNNIVSVGISLSDPDVYPYNGAIYAYKFDLFYTNSLYSLKNDYKTSSNIHLLPFAASVSHHYYIPEIQREYDVVIVGHCRKDRETVVDELDKYFKVAKYGNGWKDSLGVVNGEEHVKAINSGKMYLSFARTNAGFDNVKVGLLEAVACNQVVITKYMEELSEYFKIGEEIICYKNDEEIPQIIKYYLDHPDELEQIRFNCYKRFLKEHTYSNRWRSVINDTSEVKT